MRRSTIALALVALLLPAALVTGEPPTRADADRLYAAGDFKAAATAYRALLDAYAQAARVTAPGEVVSPGPGVLEPVVQLPAAIPGIAKGGTPILLALVNEQGRLLDVRVVRSAGDTAVDQGAIQALRGAQVKPATRDGVPVKMWLTKSIVVPPTP